MPNAIGRFLYPETRWVGRDFGCCYNGMSIMQFIKLDGHIANLAPSLEDIKRGYMQVVGEIVCVTRNRNVR